MITGAFAKQLDVQAQVLGYSSYEALDYEAKTIVYQAHLDNERNRQLERIANLLSEYFNYMKVDTQ